MPNTQFAPDQTLDYPNRYKITIDGEVKTVYLTRDSTGAITFYELTDKQLEVVTKLNNGDFDGWMTYSNGDTRLILHNEDYDLLQITWDNDLNKFRYAYGDGASHKMFYEGFFDENYLLKYLDKSI